METRQTLFARLKKESEATKSVHKLADRVKVNYVTLWRVVSGKSNGNILFWDKIYKYYGK